jgi:hypothetical protein
MKKIFLIVAFLFIASSVFAEDIKIYDNNYRYIGKISETTGVIYDKNWRPVGKISSTGKVYDRKYKSVGSVKGLLGNSGGRK